MSLLLDRIRADALAARKAKDPKAGVLVTLIGEADNKAKAEKEPKPFTDAETLALVRKFLKGIDEAVGVITPAVQTSEKASLALEKALMERAALEGYLPSQMTEAELEAFARDAISGGADLGRTMAKLKSERAGEYDGKLASVIVRKVVSELS